MTVAESEAMPLWPGRTGAFGANVIWRKHQMPPGSRFCGPVLGWTNSDLKSKGQVVSHCGPMYNSLLHITILPRIFTDTWVRGLAHDLKAGWWKLRAWHFRVSQRVLMVLWFLCFSFIGCTWLHLVARSTGCFCVTEGISGHWARTLGEESIWETRGSVSHLFLAEFPGRIREDWPYLVHRRAPGI